MAARDDIRVPFGLAVAMARQDISLVDGVLDEYEAAHRAEVLREYAEKIRTDAELNIDGLNDECCRNYGLAIARWMDSQAERQTDPTPR